MVIHGLYGSGKELAEEATNSWTHQYLKSFRFGSRLMLFEWKSHNIFGGVETGSFVGAISRCLLQGLANVGGEKAMVRISKATVLVTKLTEVFQRRSIMFVADDLGSLILKDVSVDILIVT